MPLTTGTRLGLYEIVSAIGAGGMGEVYKAKDTRLDRLVAIKVLLESVAKDADRLARFEREARAVAALSHPNILAIHEFATTNGLTYAVMELLDGETLRGRLNAGALPIRKATDIAIQIARGLAAAHDKGIVHRDLKPENVFLLRDGQVKILDFGLARQTAVGSDAAETAAALTDPGAVVGTVGYMAPEQVRGAPTDALTDLFALGAMLYEMLSGQRAFKRDTAAETMTAILKEDPPELTASRTDLSPALDRIVRHCLEKQPSERFQAARDVAFALEALSGSAASSAAIHSVPSRYRWQRLVSIPLLVIVAATAGLLVGRRLAPSPAPITFQNKTWDAEYIGNARFLPDGKTIVFSAALTGNQPDLFVIRPDALAPQALGQKATHLLSVSSRSELAVLINAQFTGSGFNGTLARMMSDGAPRPWLEHVSGADWSPDGGTLAVVRDLGDGKDHLEYPLGTPLHEAGGYLSDPRVAPDGSRVAFLEHPARGDNRGWVKIVDTSRRVTTLAGEYQAVEGIAWSTDGRAIFFSGQTGPSMEVFTVNAFGTPHVRQAVPSAGALWVRDAAASGQILTMRVDVRSSIRALIPGDTAEREFPWLDLPWHGFLSTDRKRLLFSDSSHSAGANYAVALRQTDGSPAIRLGEGTALGFSPDDKWALGQLPSTEEIILYPIGPGETVHLSRAPIEHYRRLRPLQWLPNPQRFLACGTERTRPPRCYAQDLVGGPPQPITPEGTVLALLAPDDRRLLVKTTAGAYALMTTGSAGTTPAKGFLPGDAPLSWSRDGRSVFVQASGVPMPVERVDPATGVRTLVKELGPPDRGGLLGGPINQWIDDGQGYTYAYSRGLSTLFVVSGVTGR